ncbi:transposase family protein [Streptomyces sp. NPDC048384]|uniref:transposase family protein n=1 Tax=Streptomyces sp. NPDC048384 TaxID=3155487 RepID=UPI00343DE40E
MVPPGRECRDRKRRVRRRVGAVRARTAVERAACPACGTLSARVHSRYVRRLADWAVGGRPVLIELQVRRFRCGERTCEQATFAAQVDGLTFRHGRRSTGLQAVLERVAVMLAGRAGARLSQTLTAAVSRSTLLRLIRRLPEPETTTPRVSSGWTISPCARDTTTARS